MNMNYARKVYVSGIEEPFYFNATEGTPLSDADILRLLHSYNPNIPTNATLAWREEEEDGESFLAATVIPQAQSKGC